MSDELTEAQVEELLQELRALQEELEAQLSESKAHSAPVDLDLPIGRLSRMDAIQQKHMAEANRRSAQLRLQQIQAAFNVAKEGEYGWCRQCEGPISYRRLKARPESPFCLECQSLRERKR